MDYKQLSYYAWSRVVSNGSMGPNAPRVLTLGPPDYEYSSFPLLGLGITGENITDKVRQDPTAGEVAYASYPDGGESLNADMSKAMRRYIGQQYGTGPEINEDSWWHIHNMRQMNGGQLPVKTKPKLNEEEFKAAWDVVLGQLRRSGFILHAERMQAKINHMIEKSGETICLVCGEEPSNMTGWCVCGNKKKKMQDKRSPYWH
ncbi:MAG: hypothetical protein MMC23_000344 [Stictis urceolatum]|nr:hypothetical protein [Stictis urceolata]